LGQLLGHALLNYALLNLLTSLQNWANSSPIVHLVENCSPKFIHMVSSMTKHETCEGGHLACDPCILCIQWIRGQLGEQVMHLPFIYVALRKAPIL